MTDPIEDWESEGGTTVDDEDEPGFDVVASSYQPYSGRRWMILYHRPTSKVIHGSSKSGETSIAMKHRLIQEFRVLSNAL